MVVLSSKTVLVTIALTTILTLFSASPTNAIFFPIGDAANKTPTKRIGDAASITRTTTELIGDAASITNTPTVPTLCTSSNQGSCQCGQDMNNNVITYVWWIPGDHQRCIHTFNLDSSNGSNAKKPVLVSVSAYGQGMIGGDAIERATHYDYAAIGIGSTESDGAGGFGLEFPNDWVVNAENPTPCEASDSRDYAYISDLLDFIAGYGSLDTDKVYAEGFSQNSMFAAYMGVCFADRMTGIFQGGSGLAKTGYAPVVPGKQAQCTFSDYDDLGGQCCETRFCEECTWWPVYPRTCDNEIIDCIATYTNDNIACGTDLYMYEAMVAENNDARLLSFSPSSGNSGGHSNPDHQFDWMVGCLGIVDSCSDECQNLFLNCISNDSFDSCKDDLENGSWEVTCAQGCALTLEMLQESETPVVTLSEGIFGTRTDYTAAGSTPAPEPNCSNDFGTFQEVNYNGCSADAEPPSIGPIEACGPTAPTTSSPVPPPTPVEPTTSAPTASIPLCGQQCENEWPNCVQFHGDSGCDVCSEELQTPGSTLVNRGNCVVGCALTDAMLAICDDSPPVTSAPVSSPTTPAPVASNQECGEECEDEWPNCVQFHGDSGCDVCFQELQTSGSQLVNQGNCVVGCTLTDAMLELCPSEAPPTLAPTVSPTLEPTCEDSGLPISVQGYLINCAQAAAFGACSSPVVSSHCPQTCDECQEYACEDSLAPWEINGRNVECSLFVNLDPGDIVNLCALYGAISTTCRGTCGFCSLG